MVIVDKAFFGIILATATGSTRKSMKSFTFRPRATVNIMTTRLTDMISWKVGLSSTVSVSTPLPSIKTFPR